MSDILIKNMKMPKDDIKTLMIFPDGNVRIWGTDIDPDEWAEAIEVPTPHGRLIDADAIPYIFGSTHATEYDTVTKFVINRLPTIIEEEGET